MKKDAYLQDDDVARFLEWVEPLVAGHTGIHVSWKSKGLPFECATLEQAYLRYNWRGRVERGDGLTETIATFEETARVFDEWRHTMRAIMGRNASELDDHQRFIATAKRIREWGGIRRHGDLEKLGSSAFAVLSDNARKLNPESGDTDDLRSFRHMGSGYSKIYAMMVPSLPIYDSRVACALTSLILIHCRQYELPGVPETLELGVPQSQGNQHRNPSTGPYAFPTIWHSAAHGSRYAISNLKAAWLIAEMAGRGEPFAGMEQSCGILALQSALFMIGYRRFDESALTDR